MAYFPTDLESIKKRIRAIDLENYGATRNFKDGAVTRLSPYISRGVISTKQIYDYIKSLGLPWYKCEKLIQELAWRDYWQQVWRAKGEAIMSDLKQEQFPVANHQIPEAIVNAETGIDAVDHAIKQFYESGYMHNHMRMYVASICCNMANSHWLHPAKWLYFHLLDGDLASNHLSWQWVAGAFSSKKYYANQWNINKYFDGSQQNTFLDVEYEAFDQLEIPAQLKSTVNFDLETVLPIGKKPQLDKERITLIYTYYNIDPYWHAGEEVQRVLLLEPSFFVTHPVSQKCIDFTLELAKNISGIQLLVGEFSEVIDQVGQEFIIYKEHPTTRHFQGKEEPRDWLSAVDGYFPSFFAFWKKCKMEIDFKTD
ncbi:deoxyribodipyrimidine photo-lyase [Algoriphagus ratkowskyi]|uniref:Deoxyribodipyrimidine photo-lyase n=1 Tax=Algoriphagus ratkowskyi TaxID=57028 RepID=A0A2W7SRX0_9BACT|nr:FAD-binding domain-containing protein [Algoriphagus ratkowskyi]PZX53382.1 deoxyribodipyrimidine photo-lyase [Algoriphagus ratkowskyi]TXD76573.1 deoxyribodipyrimidine photolyase [Algoriphagus ratkowskyi]